MDRERLPIASVPDRDHVPPGVGGHVYPIAGGGHHLTPRRTFSGRSRGAPAAARYCPSSVRLPCTWPTLVGRPLARRLRRRSRPHDATVNATPPGAFGHFLVRDPPPERLLIAERLRRRMGVRFADEWIADSEDVEAGVVAIDLRKSVKAVVGDVAPHPTLSEAIKGAALVARGRRSISRTGHDGDAQCVPLIC